MLPRCPGKRELNAPATVLSNASLPLSSFSPSFRALSLSPFGRAFLPASPTSECSINPPLLGVRPFSPSSVASPGAEEADFSQFPPLLYSSPLFSADVEPGPADPVAALLGAAGRLRPGPAGAAAGRVLPVPRHLAHGR